MANDNYITHFTAADIERYHKGQLSAQQMHALEKAALDDPFLADALEGYSTSGINISADLSDLKNRLNERVEGAKVIPLSTAPRQSFRALRVAVMLLFVAGAGLLLYKLGFDKKENAPIVQTNPTGGSTTKTQTDTSVKTTVPSESTTQPAIVESKSEAKDAIVKNTQGTVERSQPDALNAEEISEPVTSVPKASQTDDGITNRSATITQPGNADAAKLAEKNAEDRKKALAKNESYRDSKSAPANMKEDAEAKGYTKDRADNQQYNRNANAAISRRAENNSYYNNRNTFRGRVVDADNNGVPFANVTNVQDRNAGTFTDARGYFNLTYPDSVMNVQVRSIGFENNNVQLRNSVPSNQVVMQEDSRVLSEVTTLSRQRVDANAPSRSRDSSMKLETPEPVDGWQNYNTYVLNNIEIPEDVLSKPSMSGEVQVSFAVDKHGEPIDFKIEKSLCAKCDKEAIRLIKEGPKWKRNANKKGRTTVTIAF